MLKSKSTHVSIEEINNRNKSKVFFFSHPEDHGKYFSVLANDIFRHSDCVIWYDEPSEGKGDDIFQSLSFMHLFVIPVTDKLLNDTPETVKDIFSFAMKEHIPLLPILVESGLETRFNERFGNYQCLDKTSRDVTAISYEEKLKKFLQTVLIDDETEKKIRDSFDAYIFLSYRKKDREHAQELMRIIHSNEAFRDIAIWYDEFLTPGEDFNNLIEKALISSDLFALAVTPNILENDNYVMKYEYPMAKNQGKKIIPAELVPTDKNKLKSFYKGIEGVTDVIGETDKFYSMLINALRNIALRSDNTPEHSFFIGLAYLNGIDVERNTDIALKLITEAAEARIPEAVTQLVSIYRNGIGITADYNEAVKWQKIYIALLRKAYQEDPDEYSALEHLHELVNLVSMLATLNRLREIEAIYNELISYENEYLSYDDEDITGYVISLYASFCTAFTNMNKYAQANKTDAHIMALTERIRDKEKRYLYTASVNITRGINNNVISGSKDALSYFYEVERAFNENAENGSVEVSMEKTLLMELNYSNLASALFNLEKYKEAVKYFTKVISIDEKSNGHMPPEERPLYYSALQMLGRCYAMMQQFDKAADCLERAGIIIEKLYKKDPYFSAGAYLMINKSIAEMYSLMDEPEKTEPYLLKVREAAENVENKNNVVLENLAIADISLLIVYQHKQPDKALELLNEAMDIIKALCEKNPGKYLNTKHFVYNAAGNFFGTVKIDYQKSVECSLTAAKAAISFTKEDPRFYKMAAVSYDHAAAVYQKNEDAVQMLKYIELETDAWEKNMNVTSNPDDIGRYASCCYTRAMLYDEFEKPREVMKSMKKSYKLFKKYFKLARNLNIGYVIDYITVNCELADIYDDRRRLFKMFKHKFISNYNLAKYNDEITRYCEENNIRL